MWIDDWYPYGRLGMIFSDRTREIPYNHSRHYQPRCTKIYRRNIGKCNEIDVEHVQNDRKLKPITYKKRIQRNKISRKSRKQNR